MMSRQDDGRSQQPCQSACDPLSQQVYGVRPDAHLCGGRGFDGAKESGGTKAKDKCAQGTKNKSVILSTFLPLLQYPPPHPNFTYKTFLYPQTPSKREAVCQNELLRSAAAPHRRISFPSPLSIWNNQLYSSLYPNTQIGAAGRRRSPRKPRRNVEQRQERLTLHCADDSSPQTSLPLGSDVTIRSTGSSLLCLLTPGSQMSRFNVELIKLGRSGLVDREIPSGALVAQTALVLWYDHLPPTWANRVRLPSGSLPDFRTWESCRAMPLIDEFSPGFPVSHTFPFRRCSKLTSFHSHSPNLSTLFKRTNNGSGRRDIVNGISVRPYEPCLYSVAFSMFPHRISKVDTLPCGWEVAVSDFRMAAVSAETDSMSCEGPQEMRSVYSHSACRESVTRSLLRIPRERVDLKDSSYMIAAAASQRIVLKEKAIVTAPQVDHNAGQICGQPARRNLEAAGASVYREVAAMTMARFLSAGAMPCASPKDFAPLNANSSGRRRPVSVRLPPRRTGFDSRPLPNFRTWESCRTMPLIGGRFSGVSRFPCPCIPALLRIYLASPSSSLKISIFPQARPLAAIQPPQAQHLAAIQPPQARRLAVIQPQQILKLSVDAVTSTGQLASHQDREETSSRCCRGVVPPPGQQQWREKRPAGGNLSASIKQYRVLQAGRLDYWTRSGRETC
ncbi:hypothetical protein PR048_014153 [Dryococelus australis]|uniref:Uncharacterized protein n=1 Tax=Dryococelus australis TaxID=614101 RepID=A0ABQ9HDU3_9NEOP|nr:hypothetical protein PR048_014153 [Dryococelus australis]